MEREINNQKGTIDDFFERLWRDEAMEDLMQRDLLGQVYSS